MRPDRVVVDALAVRAAGGGPTLLLFVAVDPWRQLTEPPKRTRDVNAP
jgi:hypothetical protein